MDAGENPKLSNANTGDPTAAVLCVLAMSEVSNACSLLCWGRPHQTLHMKYGDDQFELTQKSSFGARLDIIQELNASC